MQSKVNKSKERSNPPHFSVYPSPQERELIVAAATLQNRKYANYILTAAVSQAKKDLKRKQG